MKAYGEHECYKAEVVGREHKKLIDHFLKCPRCGCLTTAGQCYPRYEHMNPVSGKKIGTHCPQCSGPRVPDPDRVLMDCIDAELTEGQKLLLMP